MSGFGNDFETEALPGALPQGQNPPQHGNLNLNKRLIPREISL
jgi:homogentisate 1,2-dioxygenase